MTRTTGLIAPFAAQDLDALRRGFRRASPFPHVVIDRFLSPAGEAALTGFPDAGWPHWQRFFDTYQREKHTCCDIRVIPPPFAALMREACEPAFLEALETITGVPRLIPDPHFDGGGLHASGPGGVLGPHTDFHLYERLGLYRALNLLIYLNPGWEEADGGALELSARGAAQPAVRVVPAFGRVVIFRTDEQSIHGFTRPVAPGKWRRSVALYYYVARATQAFSGDTNTHWQTRPVPMAGSRLALHKALIFGSRALSRLAHMVDPNVRPESGGRE
jgi:hypothetical protein